jgi:hypothetical protein
MQYMSIIGTYGGTVNLMNVTFYNIVTAPNGFVIQTHNDGSGGTTQLTLFNYTEGTISFINNGYEIVDGNSLGSFLSLANVDRAVLQGLTFQYNIFNSEQPNFLYFKNIYLLQIDSLTFENNYSPSSLICLDQTHLSMPLDSTASYQTQTNVFLNNSVFVNNSASSLISLMYKSECQTIVMTNNTFGNNSVTTGIITAQYSAALKSMCLAGGSVTPKNSHLAISLPGRFSNITESVFASNSASMLIDLKGMPNVNVSGIQVFGNILNVDANSVTLDAIMQQPGAYISKAIQGNPVQCTTLMGFNGIQGFSFDKNYFTENNCTLASFSMIALPMSITNMDVVNNTVDSTMGYFEIDSVSSVLLANNSFYNSIPRQTSTSIFMIKAFPSPSNVTISNLFMQNCTTAIQTVLSGSLTISNFTFINSSFSALQYSSFLPTTVTLTNCYFAYNKGQIFSFTSQTPSSFLSLTFLNSIFELNSGTKPMLTFGDALVMSSSVFSQCSFKNNSMQLLLVSSSLGRLQLTNIEIANTKLNTTAAVEISGSTLLDIENSSIYNNSGLYILYVHSDSNSSYIKSVKNEFKNNNASVVMVLGATFEDLSSNFEGNQANYGSALYLTDSATAFLTQTTFFNNYVSRYGTIYLLVSSSVTCNSCDFQYNYAALKGAGIFNDQNSSFFISSSVFAYNTAYQGACIFSQHSFSGAYIQSSSFSYNNAEATGCISLLESGVSIFGSTLQHNQADHYPAIEALYFSLLILNNSYFYNHTGEGAHLGAEGESEVLIYNSNFTKSYSDNFYSVFSIRNSEMISYNCRFTDAKTQSGNSVYCEKS